ncbi:uncharacterized protein cubi_00684 [Cryptosporidium ubiquitum]|uniref:Uncharacterized protein n=1 Tax=Cryptosporidium ubiquitum TaxID=857276 RepID=A0A1J4MFR9_9CRYT|nr:uncharacterized protein cubi_00684 [Cryptosporidium ubiquitum]OII71876.1 hypothetical protein cubi_00684 [Cryptosporidium ubiquitum]
MMYLIFFWLFFLFSYIGNAEILDLTLDLNRTNEQFVTNGTTNNETISDFSTLNSLKFNKILSAESTCSRKLQNKIKYPNCCSSIVTIFETEKICNYKMDLDKPLKENNIEIERELSEIKQYYDYHCNNSEYQFLVSKNITVDDIYNCVEYNGLVTRAPNNVTQDLDDIKLEGNESAIDTQRALQLNGWMNSFGLPRISSNTLLSQSRFTEGSFMGSNSGQNCSPLLSLIFVRVCNSICNANNDSSSGRSSIPIFCLRDCQPFAKFACLRGCRTFGCNVDIYTCMELMCQ